MSHQVMSHRAPAFIVLVVAGLTWPLSAQNAADTVRRLDSAWARAYAEHDTVLARALFAESLVVTSGNGKLKDREGEVADVRPAADLVLHYFRTSDVVVRVYDSSSVVTGLAEWSYTYQGSTPPTTRPRADSKEPTATIRLTIERAPSRK